MKKLLGGIAISALLAAPAIAADLPARVPVKAAPAPIIAAYNWTGCYIGVQGGGKFGKSEQVEAATGASLTGEYDIDGFLVGGTLGCNFQQGQWVFGIEGDGSFVSADGGNNLIAPFNPAFFAQTEEKWLATVRGRLGFAQGAWLFYGTGGIAFAGVEVSSASAAISASEKQTMVGWTVGGGIEWGFAAGWSLKAEYLFVDLGTDRFFDPPPAGFVTRDVDLQQHIVRAGINYRWGGGSPVVARY